ncbi:MAG: IPTL-CTERM sorting domain-containing protein [Thermoanaerobaculia bacterium]
MKNATKLALLAIVLLPGVTWAGTGRIENTVPTLGEVGLITLGVALMGAGVVAIRRRKR